MAPRTTMVHRKALILRLEKVEENTACGYAKKKLEKIIKELRGGYTK